MSGSSFLLVTWDGGGVVPPELGLARRLIDAGHRVHVLADPTIESEAVAAGCTFSAWSTAPHATSRRPEDVVIKDWEVRNPLRAMDTYIELFLGDPAPRWAADVEEVLDRHRFDGVLVDFALPAAMIPVEARGLPLVGLMPNCWILPTKGIPPMGPGFRPSSNPFARGRDAALRSLTTRLFNRALPPINATRADFGLAPVASTQAQMLAGRLLVLSSPVIDFTSPHQPDTMVYAGPILDDPAWATTWTPPWPTDDDRPLVLVAMSSGYQDQVAALNDVADALASLPVRGLVTLGLGVDSDAVRPRRGDGDVVVVQHAPHNAVLPHASVLVTHCGHGTTMKALTAFVPMVCMPMGRDQNDLAARVTHRGAGVRLKPAAGPTVIAAAVERVLGDATFARAARDLGARITTGEGCVDPVCEIEAVVAIGAR